MKIADSGRTKTTLVYNGYKPPYAIALQFHLQPNIAHEGFYMLYERVGKGNHVVCGVVSLVSLFLPSLYLSLISPGALIIPNSTSES